MIANVVKDLALDAFNWPGSAAFAVIAFGLTLVLLAGVARVLALEDELAKMRSRLDRLEREMREEIRKVHRQYRRELVLYSDPDDRLPERTRWTSRS
jgi:hypothetical protein